MAKSFDQMSESDLDALAQEHEENQARIRKKKAKKKKGEEEEKEMGFLDHLEELRWHLIRSVIAILVLMIVVFANSKFVFGTIILGPTKSNFPTYQFLCYLSDLMSSKALCIENLNLELINTQLTGQFLMHITSSIMLGFVLAFPYVFWEIWRFVKPALHTGEKNVAKGAVFFVSLLFFLGAFFGYYVVAPLSLNFLSNYSLGVKNMITLTNYVSTLTTLILACAVLFQLPMVAYFFSKIGLITPKFMKKYRRHAIVVILLISAIITPPDMFSQVLIAIPLGFLYEISIRISKRVEKKRLKDLEREIGYVE